MSEFSPEVRAVLEGSGIELFETIVSAGGIAVGDPRIAPDGEYAEALGVLAELGLVRRDPDDDERWIPVDPSAVQSRIIAPLSHEGARLLEESSEWARDFSALAQAWRRSPQADRTGPFLYVHSPGIEPYIASLVAECEFEMLTAQPQNRRDTGSRLARAIRTDTDLLKRGAHIRTLYQHSARRNTATHEYVAAVSALGGEVRTLDEFFNRMIVFDRRVAIIPSPQGLSTAIAIREPSVVAYLVDVFERSWERGRPFTSRDAGMLRDIASEQRAMTMRMLIEGHSDPAAAKRLGVSPRTYAGYVADLKEEFEVETRFQLGYVIGQRGITGAEAPPHDGNNHSNAEL